MKCDYGYTQMSVGYSFIFNLSLYVRSVYLFTGCHTGKRQMISRNGRKKNNNKKQLGTSQRRYRTTKVRS